MNILFWSQASQGNGLSGGDRIYIEFIKRWSKSHNILVSTWDQGEEMMKRNGIKESKDVTFIKINNPSKFVYLARIIKSCVLAARINLKKGSISHIYCSSEFWMDSFACFILKARFPNVYLISTWYQTAPSPIKGFTGGRYRYSALFYWLAQLPVKPLINMYADFVLVNNPIEKAQFKNKKTIVVLGAVDSDAIVQYRKNHKIAEKEYDAVFQGRFHPQKGVLELISIWKKVVSSIPKAKLYLIGDGPLRIALEKLIKDLSLGKNIILGGYIFDGSKKFSIFLKSKLVVHPAYYDSGGMASAEAMAFGMPCVGFDLPAYKTYYPVGMVTAPLGNTNDFANKIIELLSQDKERINLGEKASRYILSEFTWENRAKEVLNNITSQTK